MLLVKSTSSEKEARQYLSNVGIDAHGKRSRAVVAEDGKVQLNRNVMNGQEPILRLIGGLPAGTPVAFEATYG
jgi:transposase